MEKIKQSAFWLFTLFGIPVMFPWLLYYFFTEMMFKKRKSSLRGKVVMITGASSGLGEALAHVYYSCGCRLILISRRRDELQRVKDTLMNIHYTVPTHPPVILPLDLTEINSLDSEVAKVIKIHGTIDVLINNAGISYRGEVENTNVDVYIKVMLINYFAQVAITKAVLPTMVEQKSGHVICISSIQGKIGLPGRSAYAASKHALQAWSDCLRSEIANKNIQVTVISPGHIQTALSLNALTESGQKHGVMDEATQKGFSASYVAEEVLKSMLNGSKDVAISPLSPKIAILLRTLCPSLYFWIMKIRAKNSKSSLAKNN
ncbi:dehydrogenase/reductase SDR family protein 7-like [Leptopilina heterotoma]|uniref:dehydrogenase/reductase SDR family protein 7-like n=1 Tax=Leptopilina heterotoma TaxID=63436 RepID=UPI001CA97E0C|nr:dehydrogenase/reductase SDR family protein 7-like [Leptopilina heterotoma]